MKATKEAYQSLIRQVVDAINVNDIVVAVNDKYSPESVGYRMPGSGLKISPNHFSRKAHAHAYERQYGFFHSPLPTLVYARQCVEASLSNDPETRHMSPEANLRGFRDALEQLHHYVISPFKLPELPDTKREEIDRRLTSAEAIIDRFIQAHGIEPSGMRPLVEADQIAVEPLMPVLLPALRQTRDEMAKLQASLLQQYGTDMATRGDETAEMLKRVASAGNELERYIDMLNPSTPSHALSLQSLEGMGRMKPMVLIGLDHALKEIPAAAIPSSLTDAITNLVSALGNAAALVRHQATAEGRGR